MAQSADRQRAGYELQDILNEAFGLYEDFAVHRSFTRNGNGEQIDGAFKFDSWYYVVECRWRQEPADIRQLDGLKGQVERSGMQTMGLFLSINGWSVHVPDLLKQSGRKAIVLMDGYDFRCALSGDEDVRDLLRFKLDRLNLYSKPFASARDHALRAGH